MKMGKLIGPIIVTLIASTVLCSSCFNEKEEYPSPHTFQSAFSQQDRNKAIALAHEIPLPLKYSDTTGEVLCPAQVAFLDTTDYYSRYNEDTGEDEATFSLSYNFENSDLEVRLYYEKTPDIEITWTGGEDEDWQVCHYIIDRGHSDLTMEILEKCTDNCSSYDFHWGSVPCSGVRFEQPDEGGRLLWIDE